MFYSEIANFFNLQENYLLGRENKIRDFNFPVYEIILIPFLANFIF